MLLVVSTVRAGSRLFTTKLAPTASAWAPTSVTGASVAAPAAKTRKANRTAALIATGALIRDLLRRPSRRHCARSGAGRIVARPAAQSVRRVPSPERLDQGRIASPRAGA